MSSREVEPDARLTLNDEDALRSRYREPTEFVRNKARPVVDERAAAFIASSPLAVVATNSDAGTDASPRGGPPGFVRVLGSTRIAFADLAGNNRLDSYGNIVEHPAVGMLFLVPGLDDTLRVNGRASLSTDPAVLAATAIDGVTPKLAVVVEVEECYVHCAKAVRRSGVWDPTTWPAAGERPNAAEIVVDQFDLDVTPEVVDAGLEASYAETLWVEGGS